MSWHRHKLLAYVGILALLGGCVHQDEWSRRDTQRQLLLYTVMTADAYSTTNIQYDPTITEAAPVARAILGENPSTSDTWQYFITLGITHYFVARALPSQYRKWYQSVFIAGHSIFIVNNANLGLFQRTQVSEVEPFIGPLCLLCRPVSSIISP